MVGSAEDLANLSKGHTLLGSFLKKQGRDLHVPETHWSDRKIFFNELHIIVNIHGLNIVHSFFGKIFLGLAVGEPGQIIGADLKGVWEGQAMVDRDEPVGDLSVESIRDFLDQNVAFITVQIAKSEIKNGNFMNFLSRKKVA